MNYLERYKKKLNRNGRTTTEFQINQTKKAFDREFTSSPSYYLVSIDGEDVDAIINNTNDYEVKLINFRHDYNPEIGSIITRPNGEQYLLMEKEYNEIYRYGKMTRCNHTIEVNYGNEEKFIGYDHRGAPIYEKVPLTKMKPCYITSKYYSTNDNTQLPLPEGKISLFMQYDDETDIKVNNQFELFDKNYAVADIDMIKVESGVGVMEVIMDRKVELE